MNPPALRSFLSGKGTFGGYAVWGWRYTDDLSWHIKVWPKASEWHEAAYVVTDGVFEPRISSLEKKLAVLHLIAKWEAKPLDRH